MLVLFKENISLRPYNTFHIDVSAKRFVTIRTLEDIQGIIKKGHILRRTLVIGGGSNILFTQDYPGLVVYNRIGGITLFKEEGDKVILDVGSGVTWDRFVQYCVDHGYYGAENLSYIPGTVGAAPIQNIGAYGAQVSDIILSITGVDFRTGTKRIFLREDCDFGYRRSIFQLAPDTYLNTSVRFRLSTQPTLNTSYPALANELKKIKNPGPEDVRNAVIRIRRRKLPDPEQRGNAGSFFKNPFVEHSLWESLIKEFPEMPYHKYEDDKFKIPAAWLIEQCGWKGKQRGQCATWPSQPLVIVNLGKATGEEILDFARDIQKSVKKRFNILLAPEVRIV